MYAFAPQSPPDHDWGEKTNANSIALCFFFARATAMIRTANQQRWVLRYNTHVLDHCLPSTCFTRIVWNIIHLKNDNDVCTTSSEEWNQPQIFRQEERARARLDLLRDIHLQAFTGLLERESHIQKHNHHKREHTAEKRHARDHPSIHTIVHTQQQRHDSARTKHTIFPRNPRVSFSLSLTYITRVSHAAPLLSSLSLRTYS